MLGRTMDFLHVNNRTRRRFQEYLYQTIAKQDFFHLPEFKMKRLDGTVFPTEHSVVLLQDDYGKRIGWVSIVRDISERKRAENALRESEEKYRILVEQANDGILIVQDGMIKFANSRLAEAHGRTVEELVNTNFLDYVRPDEMPRVAKRYHRRLAGEDVEQVYETVILHKEGYDIPVEVNAGTITYQGSPAVFAFVRDHTERKRTEEKLRKAHDRLVILNKKLEEEIYERKQIEQELRRREAQLQSQTSELEEVNKALKVLLKRRDEDQKELEEKIQLNVKELVLPYLETLKNAGLVAEQSSYLNILECNLNEIVSPFLHRLTAKSLTLTPMEIRVASLVKEGKTTKDIAAMLNLSNRTVEFHRKNIRKKLGIVNRKANLRSHLLSMQ
jgi:PAS domain S-box-containing protein